MTKEPLWITVAKRYLGLKEIPGPKHNSVILKWLQKLKAWWADDETPWCGVFVAECLGEAGLPKPKNWFRALGWKDYGVEVSPRIGAILVFSRTGGGHVGFYAGEDKNNFYVLGGNQGNSVSLTWVNKSRLVACRWPKEADSAEYSKVAMTSKGNSISTNEA